MRHYPKGYNSPENKRKRSERGRYAVSCRKDRQPENREPIVEPLADLFRITVENFVTGKETVLLFHPGDRSNNVKIDMDGKHWKTCGMVGAEGLILKSLFSRGKELQK